MTQQRRAQDNLTLPGSSDPWYSCSLRVWHCPDRRGNKILLSRDLSHWCWPFQHNSSLKCSQGHSNIHVNEVYRKFQFCSINTLESLYNFHIILWHFQWYVFIWPLSFWHQININKCLHYISSTWCTLETVAGVGISPCIWHGACWAGCWGAWARLAVVPCWTHISWGVRASTAGIAVVTSITVSLWSGESRLHAVLSRVTVDRVSGSRRAVGTGPALPPGVISQGTGAVGEVGLVGCGGWLGHVGTPGTVPPCSTITRGSTKSISCKKIQQHPN